MQWVMISEDHWVLFMAGLGVGLEISIDGALLNAAWRNAHGKVLHRPAVGLA